MQEILIVAGNEQTSQLLVEHLAPEGSYHLVTIPDGDELSTYLREHPVAAMLLDLALPIAQLQRISKQIMRLAQQPALILLVGSDVTLTPIDFYRIEIRDCLFAPFQGADIRRVVAKVLRERAIQLEVWNEQLLLRRLQAAEERYYDLAMATSDLIVTLDTALQLVTINQVGLTLTGYQLPELLGSSLEALCNTTDWPIVRRELATLLHGRLNCSFEMEVRTRDEQTLHVTMHARRVTDTEGRVLIRCIGHNQTETFDLSKRLQQSEKLSRVGQLIGGVAHELNNPLTSVSGYAQLLMRDKSLSSEARQDVQQIYSQAERAGRIVRNLLLFIREHKPERVAVDLNEVIRGALSLQAYQLRVDNIVVVTNYAPVLPLTIADPHHLQQVLLNLITNAHYAMVGVGGRGTLTLTTQTFVDTRAFGAEAAGVQQGTIVLTISDTGIGIPAADLPHIFEPFYTTKPIGEGTGLGLSLCAEIIQKHRGRIWAESSLGSGTSIHIELPVISDVREDLNNEKLLPNDSDPQLMGDILIVDDEESVGQLLTRILSGMGHRPHFVDRSLLAIEMINTVRFDLILVDVKMPDLNGFEFYRAIQQRYPHLSQRVIFITGDTANPITQARLTQSNRPVLEKPFNAEQVEALVRSIFQNLAEEWD